MKSNIREKGLNSGELKVLFTDDYCSCYLSALRFLTVTRTSGQVMAIDQADKQTGDLLKGTSRQTIWRKQRQAQGMVEKRVWLDGASYRRGIHDAKRAWGEVAEGCDPFSWNVGYWEQVYRG